MKIAQVTPVYPPHTGGIGSVAQEYAQYLLEIGYKVSVFTPNYNCENSFDDTLEKIKPIYKWGNAALIPKLIKKLKGFDLIHLHYPFYGGDIFAVIASLIWRTPLIVTYHMKTTASGWLGSIFFLHRILIQPFILWAAKYICVSSVDYAESIGLNPKKLVELPFSVNIEKFTPVYSNEVRKRHGITQDSQAIIFVGGLDKAHYFKGVNILIDACSAISKEQKWDLIIVGDGDLKKEYQEKAVLKNVFNNIHFVGRVLDHELPSYYQASDIHVLPAINKCEAFGLVTLEAAASGIPSIVSNLPGVRTLVKERETGLIVPPSNIGALTVALTFLLQKHELRKRFGRNARIMVENSFQKNVILKQLKELYDSIEL